MKELYELKEKLCDQLKEYGKHDVNGASLSAIDTLAHAIKNIDKIIDGYDSSGYYPWGDHYSRRGMGRYSRDGLVDKLHNLMNEAPDEKTRMEIQRLIDKM